MKNRSNQNQRNKTYTKSFNQRKRDDRPKKEEHYLEKLSNHVNICSLQDLFYEKSENDGFVKYMVTECGVNTLGYLASNVYINEDNLKHFVRQMLMSIMHCHNNNTMSKELHQSLQ